MDRIDRVFDPEKAHRRSIRLRGYDYSSEGWYFLTLCTHLRQCTFGSVADETVILSDIGRLVDRQWLDIPNRFPMGRLGAYVIMPTHLHGIIGITRVGANQLQGDSPLNAPNSAHGTKPHSLPAIIQSFKSTSTKTAIRFAGHDLKIWQRNYYEHIIRSQKSFGGDHQIH